ncbi:MAG: AAA family ATPase [Saprospiraceae bacterium]|nr:AAA family ATPase [Saprospiraceae bacterium]
MIETIDKKFLNPISRGKETIVYRYAHPDEPQVYILKTFIKEYPNYRDLADFHIEYEYLKDIDITGVRKALQKIKFENRPSILFEEAEGVTLDKYDSLPWDIQKFLRIAIRIVDLTGQLHEKKFIHKDLKPQNIIIHPETERICIIDFSHATRLTQEKRQPSPPNQLQGTLPYLAPEMTGRMNRIIDYRSDLYSLGIIFYELLLGHLPFQSHDPLELIHHHLAKEPDLTGIPTPLDQIIGKLLSKNAEDRYQSAFGLKHDLEQCLELLTKFGSLLAFPLGMKDVSAKFHIPQKLYGREQEVLKLNELLDATSSGSNQFLLVSGFSGIGKTSLVQEVYKPLTRQKGYYTYGKFSQFQRNVPYLGLFNGLNLLFEQILKEPAADIANWREKIQSAVGGNGILLTESIPALIHIIGEQPPVAVLTPIEAKNRFYNTLLGLIMVFQSEDRVLVFFLDDLQWADLSSLEFVESLLADHGTNHLLLIGAYRNNEVDADHPLLMTVRKLKATNNRVTEVNLKPLPREVVNQIVGDTLKANPIKCAELGQLIFEKTNGNPFFVNQFLHRLYDDELIRFNRQNFQWEWEIQVIKAMNITDNVVHLMTQKLQQFELETQQILATAACIGHSFDLDTLSLVQQRPKLDIARGLWPAIQEGITPPVDENYRYVSTDAPGAEELDQLNAGYQFLHDRIHEAAYRLLSPDDLVAMNYRIGQIMLKKLTPPEAEMKLFDILNHFDQCTEAIRPEDVTELIPLYLKAAKKAKTALAHDAAINFLNQGLTLMPEDPWEDDTLYPLAFEYHYELAESQYLSGHHDLANQLMTNLLIKSKNPPEKVRIYLLQGILYTTIGRFADAAQACTSGLALLGITLPEAVTPELLGAGMVEIETLKAGKSIAELEDLPIVTDLSQYFPVLLLAVAATPIFFIDKLRWVYTVMELVKTSLKQGNSDLSDLGYVAFGVVNGTFGQYGTGYEWGKLAVRLNQRFNKVENRAKVYHIFGQMVLPWQKHYEESLPYAEDAYKYGVETGDLIYGGFAAIYLAWVPVIIGHPIEESLDRCKQGLQFYDRIKDLHRWMLVMGTQYLQALQGKTHELSSLTDDTLNEATVLQQCEEQQATVGYFMYWYCKIILYYLQGKYDKILPLVAKINEIKHILQGTIFEVDIVLYHSLALIENLSTGPAEHEAEHNNTLETNLQLLKVWAENAPENFRHKYLLVEAEKAAKLTNDQSQATVHYDTAIKAANNHKYLRDEGLINELAARFYLKNDRVKIARAYMNDAIRCYSEWGAYGIIKHLKELYPMMVDFNLDTLSQTIRKTTVTSTTKSGSLPSLDLHSLMKATMALSGEVIMEKLLHQLLAVVLEAAGAERSLLIAGKEDEGFFVEADGSINDTDWSILHHRAIPEATVPAELIQYVLRTKKTLVISHASNDDAWKEVPYIKAHRSLSIACIPVLLQGKITGIIYLENNLTPDAFTPERVEILQMLAAQMAISVENALLYRDLEYKVSERTRVIEQQKAVIDAEKQKSDSLLFNILPKSTAEELKKNGFVEPKLFDQVSIMFTDFQGFTRITEQIPPQELIHDLNECFLAFDEICEKNNLERIKTIGDAYMCASGVPIPNPNHARDTVRTALEINTFIKKWSAQRQKVGKIYWPIRIGVHTGTVVAGVIGMKKFAYDIWGDAVNVASRMESNGEEGFVNISQSTYDIIKDDYNCEYRGKVKVKNKGEVDMYFVLGKK